jgi:hypothetical protein
MSLVKIQGNVSGTGTLTIAAPNTNTDRTLTLPDATGTVVTKSSTYIATSELGSGTANGTTFLRGDQSWQTISTAPTTQQVLDAIAGASVGAVGTYAFLAHQDTNTYFSAGTTYSGSVLRYSGIGTGNTDGGSRKQGFSGTPAGTWRAMGTTVDLGNTTFNSATLFLRIS